MLGESDITEGLIVGDDDGGGVGFFVVGGGDGGREGIGAGAIDGTEVGCAVVGCAVVGSSVVGSLVVGANVVGDKVVGASVVGSDVIGAAEVGFSVVGAFVVGGSVVGFSVTNGSNITVGAVEFFEGGMNPCACNKESNWGRVNFCVMGQFQIARGGTCTTQQNVHILCTILYLPGQTKRQQ